ncbi:MAG TPA: hypothetical protein VG826_22630 [Pirellulales bacterium]|nr:hypothetical protein [Pirellulales bacterium]
MGRHSIVRLGWLVLAVASGNAASAADGLAGPALAGEPRGEAVRLAGHYVESVVSQAQAQAAAETLKREQEWLSSGGHPGASVTAMLSGLADDERRALAEIAEKEGQKVVRAIERDADDAAAEGTQLIDDWRGVRTTLYNQQLELYEVKASQQIAGQMASLLSVDNRWFWLCGLFALGSVAAVTLHERRHEIRRWLNGGRARALGLSKFLTGLLTFVAIVTLATFVFGDRLYQWLLQAGMGAEPSPRQAFVEQNKSIDAERAQAQEHKRSAEAAYKDAANKWRTGQPDAASAAGLLELTQRASQAVVRLTQELASQRTVADRLRQDLKELDSARAKIAQYAAERDAYRRQREWIRGGLGVGLLGLAATGGLLFKRQVRGRQRKTRETCPLCLGEGTFEPTGDASHPGLEMVRCKNVISEHPYEECDFTFSAMYRQNVKLCFPTLGIPQAGKTHWLAMVYRELNRGNYPSAVQFERIRSTSSDDFDIVVDEILNKKLGPMATQVGRIPHPLIFNFLDHDRFGTSNVLVNIFDYSGEVIRSQTIDDRQRQRALDGDGFFFFLDPTEPSETQSQALAGFREDLRRIKGIGAGKQVHVPIALCVSKIDLMVSQPYADPHGGGAIEKFYRDLGEIDWDMSIQTIEARSKVMGQLRDTIWPGWQIERQIDDLFGGRFLFFPLSPVGLDGLGERDLSRRTIAPVGLLEPLLWLLHMNGYPVLG